LDLELFEIQKMTEKFSDNLMKHQHNACATNIQRKIGQRIKVAYLSGDFTDHAVGLLVHNLFKYHNKKKFEVTAIALTVERTDPFLQIIQGTVEHFIDLSTIDTSQAIHAIVALKLDILIDLSGLTERARPQLLANKLANVIFHWVGYPGTLSLPT